MVAVSPFLDEAQRRRHKLRNIAQSIALIAGIGLLTIFCAYLLWGSSGVLWTAVSVGLLIVLNPRISPQVVMRMFRARPIDPKHGTQLYRLIEVLADRAELSTVPRLYVVPSMTLNAFAVGRPEGAAIAVTEGLLRKLNFRELAGVLAHEVSHIRNNDLWIMGLADVMSRLTQFMSYLAVFLVLFNLPAIITDSMRTPWLAIILLYLAPTISSLLQLGLSRAREYDADLEAAQLTGDPEGLAQALLKLEQYQGRFWEDLVFPGRKIPQPSLLRSHPSTEDRVARLRELEPNRTLPPIEIVEEPMVTLVGLGPIAMRPRYRLPGVWF